MSFTILNHTIQKHLIRAFAVLDEWFDREPELLCSKPDGEASIAGLMASIVLNNKHMLQVPTFDRQSSIEYKIDYSELEQAARYWRFPKEDEFVPDLVNLRRQLRDQLEQALTLLETSQLLSTETYNPLANTNGDSWDGYHRLYFMGLLIRQYIHRFRAIEVYLQDMIIG
jgi:hypothetical protein